jgi:hypothetical protein
MATQPKTTVMGIRSLFLYLTGNSQAILEIARDRRAIWVGLLFVLSAGLARDYDGEDLVHQPWRLAIPFAASLLTSFLLYLVTYGRNKATGPTVPPFPRGYRMFLGLFWMTAPLAWLYAVPYERFFSSVGATRANLCTLAIVAIWRVLLMVRVLTVLMGYRWWAALALIMIVADIEAVVAMQFVKVPLIDVMGGLRLSESDALIKQVAVSVVFFGVLSFPVWLIGAIVARCMAGPHWPLDRFAEGSTHSSHTITILACMSLLIWLPILPFTQREQLLRHRVEEFNDRDDFHSLLQELSRHAQSEYPPLYDPPPPKPYFGYDHRVLVIVEIIADDPPADWVRAIYLRKFARALAGVWNSYYHSEFYWEQVARVLDRLPEGQSLIDEAQGHEPAHPGLKEHLETVREKAKKEAEQKAVPPN